MWAQNLGLEDGKVWGKGCDGEPRPSIWVGTIQRGTPLCPFADSKFDSVVKNPPAKQEMQVQCLDREDPLEEGMATHSGTLAWEIPWTEEPGGQQRGSQRAGHDLATKQ